MEATFKNDFSHQAIFWFWVFLITHTVLWTIAPTLVRFHLPIDSLEMSTWSHHLLWGYEKNPYFNAWVMAFVNAISNYSDWAIYLSSKLAVAICFWGLWRLGRQFLSASHTLVGILILEAVQYFSFGAIELNDNVLELALWSLMASYFYSAMKSDALWDWVIFSLCAGLGLMTKYLTLLLLISLGIFYGWTQYKAIRKPSYLKIALSFAIILVICLPHLYWLTENQFAPLKYLHFRLDNKATFLNHLLEPLYFALAQIGNFVIAAIILLFAFRPLNKSAWLATASPRNDRLREMNLSEDRLFLIIISLGPLALSCLVALITGSHLHTMWGQPFLIWWGLLFVAFLQPTITSKQWYRFIAISFLLLLLSCNAYIFSMLNSNAKASSNYPGREITLDVEKAWQSHFPHKPLRYVIGDRWRAGSVAHYSQFHPDTFIEADPYYAPWINQQDMLYQGGVVFWDQKGPEFSDIPTKLLKQFPDLKYGEVRTYHMLRDPSNKVLYLGWAFLPPR